MGSSIPTFKAVEFHPGMNIVLADQGPGSSGKDSRNGVGKTTLMEIVHFCLGGKLESDSTLGKPALGHAEFWIELELDGVRFSILRGVASEKTVLVAGMPDEWILPHRQQLGLDGTSLSLGELRTILGERAFGLGREEKGSHYPTFRSLFSFIAREGQAAYLSPFSTVPQMSAGDKQVLNSFLLGLGWEYAVQWQAWRERNEAVKSLKKALKGGALAGLGGVGELEADRVRLSQQHQRVARELADFRVLPEYQAIEREANRLTRAMQRRQNENVADAELLRMYEASLQEEADTEPQQLLALYEEAGVVLGEQVRKRLDEVKKFHSELIANRRTFLTKELSGIRSRIEERTRENQADEQEKAKYLGVLKEHRALDEYTQLQALNNELAGRVAEIESRIELLNGLEKQDTSVKGERIDLAQRTRADFIERRNARDAAVAIFNENSESLYNAPGTLIIDIGENGYTFDVRIEREGSEGIDKMKIFCYDLMLARLWSGRRPSPLLLMHDSTLFDGVDERQRGHALERAYHESDANGFQYIVFLNSDNLPRQEYLGEFCVDSHVRVRLDDT
ncbi:DUF2326 domain-containing protein, partial [bacterium]